MGPLRRLLVEKMRMLKEDALAVAHVVEEAFEGRSELEDGLVAKELRQVFYDLQDEKILEVRREDVVEDGRPRRQYYWRVRDTLETPLAPPPDPTGRAERIYDRLADHAWQRRKPGA